MRSPRCSVRSNPVCDGSVGDDAVAARLQVIRRDFARASSRSIRQRRSRSSPSSLRRNIVADQLLSAVERREAPEFRRPADRAMFAGALRQAWPLGAPSTPASSVLGSAARIARERGHADRIRLVGQPRRHGCPCRSSAIERRCVRRARYGWP